MCVCVCGYIYNNLTLGWDAHVAACGGLRLAPSTALEHRKSAVVVSPVLDAN